MDLKTLKDEDVIHLYGKTVKELKSRGIIRTKNVVGDLGEYLAINYYNSRPDLPNLQTAVISAENIDATGENGEGYSIKSCTRGVTGVFHGLEPKGSTNPNKKVFDYAVVCEFNDDYELQRILEISWDNFLKHKIWHSRMQAWNLRVNKDLIADSKIIYQK